MDNSDHSSIKNKKKPWISRLQDSVGNTVKFRLRRLAKTQRGKRLENKESKNDLFRHLEKSEQKKTLDQALFLKKQFHLDHFWEKTSRKNLLFNLFYIEMLDKALTLATPRLPEIISVADIGSSNWEYVQGLHAVIKWWRSPAGRQLQLTGFEKDPYRINTDHYSCFDHALGHIDDLKNVHYQPVRFKQQTNQYNVITIVHPFVFPQDHINWGLPSHTFNPHKQLLTAWNSIKPGGALIIINQGRTQHLAQREIMLTEEIEPLVGFPHESILYDYDMAPYVLISIKNLLR